MEILEKFLNRYGDNLERLVSALLILLIGYWVSKVIRKITMAYIEKSNHDEIVLNFFHTIIKVVFTIIIILTALSTLGVDMTSLVAMFTAAAAAIALAVKETLSELIDGIMILFAKPFGKGDLIEVSGTVGKVQEISLFYTYMLTVENEKIIIPNSTVARNIIINYSSSDARRIDLDFDVAYESDIDEVKKIIHMVAKNHPLTLDIKPMVVVKEYKESSVTFLLRAWATPENWEKCKFSMLEDVKKALDDKGIEIPYPQLDLHIKDVKADIS